MACGGSSDDTGVAAAAKDAVVDIIAKQLCREDCRAQLEEGCYSSNNDADAPPSKFVGVAPLKFVESNGGYTSGAGCK